MNIIWIIITLVVPFHRKINKININKPSDLPKPTNAISFSHLHQNAKFERTDRINCGLGKERILFVDEDIIIADKPAYLQTVPGYTEHISLASTLQQQFKVSSIEHMTPHRLDYQTSGIVILTRNLPSLTEMQRQFRENEVYKRYTAIVNGRFTCFEGEIDLPIAKDLVTGPPLQTIDVMDGKPSLTHWHVTDTRDDVTKLDLILKSGRTHQLRLHLAATGHPILGDLFYAPTKVYRSSSRLLLHAEEIQFYHPRTKQEVKVISKAPFTLSNYRSSIFK